MKRIGLTGLFLAVWIAASAGISSAATVDVSINSFFFAPTPLTINAGDTIHWTNEASDTHTITSGSNCTPDGRWDSGFLAPGQSFSRLFDTPGTFDYYCEVGSHCADLGMEGRIIVQNAVPSTSPLPDIKANGSDAQIVLGTGASVSITVTLDAGSSTGQNADWWVAASTPFGWFYYDALLGQFRLVGDDPASIPPSIQMPLFNVSTPFELLSSSLPPGSYTFYFGVDTNADAVLDTNLFLDAVEITAQ